MSLRIAQVAPLYESVPPRVYGGTERVVAYLVEGLVAAGHDVTLFASGDSQASGRLVPVCDRALRGTSPRDPLAPHIREIGEVYRRASSYDVIHFHLEYIHFPAASSHPARHLTTIHNRLDVPEVSAVHGTFVHEPLVSISDAQRLPLARANWLATVPHGLPRTLLSAGPGGGGYLAYLGRMSPEKGPLEAIELARATGMPLLMAAKVGWPDDAYYRDVVAPVIARNKPLVEFLGELGDRDKGELLRRAEALAFPIQWPEPFGLVLIEALACGTPIIAYRRGSVPEIVEDGVTGFVVEDLAQAVDAAGRLGTISRAACRRSFEKRFTADRMCRDYEVLYRTLAGTSAFKARPTTVVSRGSHHRSSAIRRWENEP